MEEDAKEDKAEKDEEEEPPACHHLPWLFGPWNQLASKLFPTFLTRFFARAGFKNILLLATPF